MTELKPCPFCGGEANTLERPHVIDIRCSVGCDDDECRGFIGLSWLYKTEAEAVAAWNTRADYHGYEQAAVDAWKSIKEWNGEAIAATLGGGELTAEQVHNAVSAHRNIMDNRFYCDWQAIADELNAALGSGACEDVGQAAVFKCSKCGWYSPVFTFGDGMPQFCPSCGAKIRKAVER